MIEGGLYSRVGSDQGNTVVTISVRVAKDSKPILNIKNPTIMSLYTCYRLCSRIMLKADTLMK